MLLEKLKQFKTKECVKTSCKIIQKLMFHQYTQITVATILFIVGSILSKFVFTSGLLNKVFTIMYGTGVTFLILFMVVLLVFAWIINPIRSLLKKRKK